MPRLTSKSTDPTNSQEEPEVEEANDDDEDDGVSPPIAPQPDHPQFNQTASESRYGARTNFLAKYHHSSSLTSPSPSRLALIQQFKVHKKSAADANPLSKEYEDITLNCRDCNAEFIFSGGEQEFYQSKGWENQPTRCTECKNAKKARFGEGPASKPVCYAFQRGECTRGDACRFSHEEGGGGGGGGGYDRPPSRGAPACYAFQRGECDRGDSCRFSHDANAGTPQRNSAPCYAFQKGECTRGDACRFSHDPNAEAPQRSSAPCYAFQKGECDRGDSCRFSHE